jgi:hypothetical protein
MKYFLAIVVCAIITCGCIPTKPESEVDIVESVSSVSALIDELVALLNDPVANSSIARPYQICAELVAMDPLALSSIVELVGSVDTSDMSKIFILQVVFPYMSAGYIPSIKTLLDSDNGVTRSCATSLLGPIVSPEVIELLVELRSDENSSVAFSAWSGLALQGEEPHRSEFVHFYTNPEAIVAQRDEIIRVILYQIPQLDDMPILSMAVNSLETDGQRRRIIVTALGDLGTIDCVEPLKESVQFESGSDYQVLVDSAIALIKERNRA